MVVTLFNLISYYFNFLYIYVQDLEKSLKATCEEFIMSVTKLVVDPMLSFVTKVCLFSLQKYGWKTYNVFWCK